MRFVAFMKKVFNAVRKPWLISIMVALLVWISFMAFRQEVISWSDTHLFPLLEMSRSGWSDLLLCCVALFCGYYSYCKTPKVISTGWLSMMFCGWLLLILFIKFDNQWISLYLLDCKLLPYAGVLLFALTVPWTIKYIRYLRDLFLIVKRRECMTDNAATALQGYMPLRDDAVDEESNDRFGWSNHVKSLIRDIGFFNRDGSVSLAITGAWGSGKTSYLNILKKKLEKRSDDYIILEFNPRRSSSASSIQNDFLCQLRSSLADYDCSVGSSISKYVEALNLVDEKSFLPKLISLTGIDSPEHYKASIEEVITSTGKSLIVLIDDLDRLTGTEIMEVLKLVNLNVNFKHSVFISAFDKDYIEKALASIIINRRSDSDDSSGIRNYTDKYFTLERPLPSVKPHKLLEFLYEIIKRNDETEESTDFNQTISSLLSSNLNLISDCLPTIRDIKRFANLFIPAYQERMDDVIFDDFFLITLLRYSYPSTYEKVRRREIVNTNALDDTSQIFRFDSSEEVAGNNIIQLLFEKYNKASAFSLDRKHFKSIRHRKAFPFYFYEYDDSSIRFKDYQEIADPETDIQTAIQKLKELTVKGSDTYSILMMMLSGCHLIVKRLIEEV